MLAVFKTGGKQYSVKAGQILKVEKLEGEKGDIISHHENSPNLVNTSANNLSQMELINFFSEIVNSDVRNY